MGILGEYFGSAKYLTLAEGQNQSAMRPKTVDSNTKRIKQDKKVLRELYQEDWFTFASVNVASNLFAKPRFEITSETEEGVKVWKDFFDDMRLYGNNTSLKRLRADLKKDAVTYGAGYLEFVQEEGGREILDLKHVDAAILNKAKDKKNHLILDSKGNSIGYVLGLGPNADLRSKGDPVPPEYVGIIDMTHGDIFINPERIAEFPLYRLGNGVDSVGMVEPAVLQTRRRRKLEEAQVNAIWIRGTAPLFASVGDDTHEPNPQMMSDALDALEDMKHSSVTAFPNYIKPDVLDAKIDDIATKIMSYLMAAEAGTANLPMPFVTGAGEATNRSTLKSQREMLEINMQEKIDNFDEDWNLQVMNKVAEFNEFPEARIVSEELRLEAKDEMSKRLKQYADIGKVIGVPVMSPEEFRNAIKINENFRFDDPEYKTFVKNTDVTPEKEEEVTTTK